MNIITDNPQSQLTICGEKYRIKTDFKTWIKFTLTAFGNEPTPQKTVQIFKLVFIDMPCNLTEAVKALLDFYNPQRNQKQSTPGKKQPKVFDFDFDADSIYAAFLQQYGIDLNESEMHWHTFKALFDNLTDDTRFIKAVGYRAVNLSEIKSDEMRKFYTEMKHLHALPDNRTDKQKEQDFSNSFFAAFMKGKQR